MKKHLQTVIGLLIVPAIFGIVWLFVAIKDYRRQLKREARIEEQTKTLNAYLKPYQTAANELCDALATLSNNLTPHKATANLNELPQHEMAIYGTMISQRMVVSPFLPDSTLQLNLAPGQNAFVFYDSIASDSTYAGSGGDRCSQELCYRIRNNNWHNTTTDTVHFDYNLFACIRRAKTARYVVVVQPRFWIKPVQSSIQFVSGKLFCRLSIIDLTNNNQEVAHAYFMGSNSDQVYAISYDKNADMDKEMERQLRKNLYNNTLKMVEETLTGQP